MGYAPSAVTQNDQSATLSPIMEREAAAEAAVAAGGAAAGGSAGGASKAVEGGGVARTGSTRVVAEVPKVSEESILRGAVHLGGGGTFGWDAVHTRWGAVHVGR